MATATATAKTAKTRKTAKTAKTETAIPATVTKEENATVNTTETREPTATERAETALQQDAQLAHARSIQEYSAALAVAAYGEVEAQTYLATVGLALSLCSEQIKALLTGEMLDPAVDAFVFRKTVLAPVAAAGRMVYRDTGATVEHIATLSGAERDKAVNAYVMSKGAKLVRSLATLRTYGFRLATYVRDNMPDAWREAAMAPSPQAAHSIFARHVSDRFGMTFAGLSSELDKLSAKPKGTRKPKAAKPEAAKPEAGETTANGGAGEATGETGGSAPADPVQAALAIVREMDAEQLASFMHRLQEVCRERDAQSDAVRLPQGDAGETAQAA